MTSGNFRSYPLSSITVLRNERQRRNLTNIDELAESLARVGLIHPIVITSEGVLVAGERRLTAARSLGWTSIIVQFVEDLSPLELESLELEENVRRVDLTWQEHCLAIARFHSVKEKLVEGEWTQAQSANALGLSPQEVSTKLAVAQEIASGNERVATADKFSTARNLVQRAAERKRTSTLAAVVATALTNDETAVEQPVTAKPVPILLGDFHEWAAAYTDTPFNLIHCDFPYGINVAESPRMGASIKEHYDDSPDVYWALLDTLEMGMSNVVADSAHLIFWFSLKFYTPTLERLDRMGWKVDPFPFIWHKSDNTGIAPDPQRGARRTYETAFFASRGDRKLTSAGPQANSFSFPGKHGSDSIHMSQKPVEVVKHFLRMICDDYSTVLDPTCGSGNALKAATALGAPTVLGIEKSPDFYATSVARYYGEEND